MKNLRTIILCGAIALLPSTALAQMPSAPMVAATAEPTQAPLTRSEQALYLNAQPLLKLYATPAAAIKAGWFRFNNEDRTGAISYINPTYYDTPDALHPQQLWYDVNGRLLGADFSQLVATHPSGPDLLGISRNRFDHAQLHVHFGLRRPDGTIEYGLYVRAEDFVAGGLDPLNPTAQDLVTLHKLPSAKDVVFIFAARENWDATMWLIPNPAGQFADANPNVKPSANQGKSPAERRL